MNALNSKRRYCLVRGEALAGAHELAEILASTAEEVQALAESGRIPSIPIGADYRFCIPDVLKALKQPVI